MTQKPVLRDLHELAADIGVGPDHVQLWGPHVAKIDLDALGPPRPGARHVLVTAMTPDGKGAGKTTVSLALGDALRRRGRHAAVTIRQSSTGPTFGAKGGGGGGGAARVEPLDRSLLHLSGDLHAVTAAHNMVAALLDNAWHHGRIDLSNAHVQWNRVADINDRFLRSLEVGFGDKRRRTRFELTAASELMAILALVDGHDHRSVVADLRARIGRTILGFADNGPISAEDIGAAGAATALLVDAVKPNLMQSAAGTPVLIHAGPFANIAHGCSSIVADRIALHGADWVVTEAGFGAEIGAEKFFDIKCRTSGFFPDVAVLVATHRAIESHGSTAAGLDNLRAQIANTREFGVGVVVAINRYASDPASAYEAIADAAHDAGAEATAVCDAYARGAEGAVELADALAAAPRNAARTLYDDDLGIVEKLEIVARRMYGAAGVELSDSAREKLELFGGLGAHALPVCIAKTPSSLSGDPSLKGAPTGHVLEVADLRLSAGAGYVYALTSKVLTMPGMGVDPRALHIDVDEDGGVIGIA